MADSYSDALRDALSGLADALDLMVVCVEAGLTVGSAMQRVGSEMVLAHPEIARELNRHNIRTPRGCQWYACTVKAQLPAEATA